MNGLSRQQCTVTGCCRERKWRGLCRPHYDKARKYGDPLVSKRVKPHGETTRLGAPLASRERQVLELIALGEGCKAIAARLNVYKSTVSEHRRRMLEKLGLKNNAQVAVYAFVNGITKFPNISQVRP